MLKKGKGKKEQNKEEVATLIPYLILLISIFGHKRNIFSDYKSTQTYNHLVCKQTVNRSVEE